MRNALKQLLNDLDTIFEEHEELGDTDVREQMYEAMHDSFIVPRTDYTLPHEFGMFSEVGNQKVRAAIEKFVVHPEIAVASKALTTPEARLTAFQNSAIESDEGNACDEHFGRTTTP